MDNEFENRLTRLAEFSPSPNKYMPYRTSPGSPFSPSKLRFHNRTTPGRDSVRMTLTFEQESVKSATSNSDALSTRLTQRLFNQELLQVTDENEMPPMYQYHENMAPRPHNLFTHSPLSDVGHKLLRSHRHTTRKIPRIPYKVLDAPELQDDFYLNLVDWSSLNMLAVGLGSCVYLWNANNCNVTKLTDLQPEGDAVTSVSWSCRGDVLAVGTQKGLVQMWDTASLKMMNCHPAHASRVGALAWSNDMVCSGSRDRSILQRDMRGPRLERKLSSHKQEVCGLRFSPDHQYLASGGNDNKLFLWSVNQQSSPVHEFKEHTAAVKAIAWSPHQHGLLASGGGTADRCIRFWNVLTGQPLHSTDTGSQVCNLAWSKHADELVSTHGYSQNQIVLWSYPNLRQLAKLTGHTLRVLYLAMSPDGYSICTGAGDETLRFWHIFAKHKSKSDSSSELNVFSQIK